MNNNILTILQLLRQIPMWMIVTATRLAIKSFFIRDIGPHCDALNRVEGQTVSKYGYLNIHSWGII